MQKFTKNQHKQFINYFNIKENPTQVELDFYEKTEKYLKFIKWIPGLRMVGVGNSISMNCSSYDSDIDLYIVTTGNSMWFNRILITIIFQLLGVRKTANKHAGRFCLSFFSTLDGMDFSSWKIENDIYLYFWILYFKPILDYNDTYSLFLKKNSSWADFSTYNDIIIDNKTYIKYKKYVELLNSPYQGIKKIFFPLIRGLGGSLNNILKKLFLPKTIKSYNHLGKPYGIIINENILKFHDNDIRKETRDGIGYTKK